MKWFNTESNPFVSLVKHPTYCLQAVEEAIMQSFSVSPGSSSSTVPFSLPVTNVSVVCSVAAGAQTRGGAGGAGVLRRHDLTDVASRVLVAALVAPFQVVFHQRAVLLVTSSLDARSPALPVADSHVLSVGELPLAALAFLVQTCPPIKCVSISLPAGHSHHN